MKHVLVLDDNQVFRETTAELLSLSGFHVCVASNIKQFMDCLLHDEVNAILMDLNMSGSGMNGKCLIDYISSVPRWKNIPLIIITGYPEDVTEEFEKNPRIYAVLRKGSYHPNDLSKMLKNIDDRIPAMSS